MTDMRGICPLGKTLAQFGLPAAWRTQDKGDIGLGRGQHMACPSGCSWTPYLRRQPILCMERTLSRYCLWHSSGNAQITDRWSSGFGWLHLPAANTANTSGPAGASSRHPF